MTFEFTCQRVLGYVFLGYSVLYSATNVVLLWYNNDQIKDTITNIQQVLYIFEFMLFGILFIWSCFMSLDHFCGTYSFRNEYEALEGDTWGKHHLPGLQRCMHSKTSCCNHAGHTYINLGFTTVAFIVTIILFLETSGWVMDVVFATTSVAFVGNVYDTIVICTNNKYKKSGSTPY